MTTFINIHSLQPVGPSCLNRDDTGTPKTATFGGVLRHRVSSQALKRAARMYMREHIQGLDFGVRTVMVPEKIAEKMCELRPELDKGIALEQATDVVHKAGIKLKEAPKSKATEGEELAEPEAQRLAALMFISNHELYKLAEVALAAMDAGSDVKAKDARDCLVGNVAVDIALSGRMLADAPELNVDAACQVAHAISVDRASVEFDYFTAMDDLKKDDTAGATMIGSNEFISSTLYRFATINFDRLVSNLGDREVGLRAVDAAIRSYVLSLPSGRQNTYATPTRPDCVLIEVRTDQPTSWVGAFEKPIAGDARSSVTAKAVHALLKHSMESDAAYGTAPIYAGLLVNGALRDMADMNDVVGDRVEGNLDEIISQVVAQLAE